MDIRALYTLGKTLFEKKYPLNLLHQEIAENFYPQRADFTVKRSLSEDFASELSTSWPLICHRDFSGAIGQMLRPKAKPWFHLARKYTDKDIEDTETRQALEWFETVMRRAMYDRRSFFTRAAKKADADFSAFGQFVMNIDLNRNLDGLLFRTCHLRDFAWKENADGDIGFIARKWKPTIQVLSQIFGKDRLDRKLQDKLDKNPFEEHEVMHFVCDSEMYSDDSKGLPRFSIWYDPANEHIIEAEPTYQKKYIIPRWQLVGTQYAYSPAVIAALPDARLIQAMTWTLLEVGEKAANPPMLATMDTVRSDLALYAGGVTWIDQQYDERLGDAMRPLSQDFRGIGYGMEMSNETKALIKEAFFLNALTPFNPATDPEMTAFQAGQYVQEYIRKALPIFEPMEDEYNATMCEEVFEILVRNGAYGSSRDWPKSLQNAETEFKFESPLHDIIDQQKSMKWMEAKALLADAIALDPSTAYVMNASIALRDTLDGIGAPANWLNTEDDVKEMVEAAKEEAQTNELLEQMKTGSETAKNISQAEEALV